MDSYNTPLEGLSDSDVSIEESNLIGNQLSANSNTLKRVSSLTSIDDLIELKVDIELCVKSSKYRRLLEMEVSNSPAIRAKVISVGS